MQPRADASAGALAPAFHTTGPPVYDGPGLSVERRHGRFYLYARVWAGGKLRGKYLRPLTPTQAAALRVRSELRRDRRAAAKRAAVVAGERATTVLTAGTEFDRLAGGVFKATMAAAGFRLHKRHEWRRARGVTPVLTFPDLLQYAPTARATPLPPAPPPAARPGLIRPSSPEPEVQAILDRAAQGDAAVLPAVRGLIRDRRFLDALGDVADVARERLVKLVAGDDVAVAEATRQKLAEVIGGLLADAGPRPTFAEGLAAGRAAHAWLTVHVIEAMAARYPAGSPEAVAVEKHLGQAERRYQAALKALAVLRRLRGPVVVANQVNLANGPMLVDNRGAAVGGC